MTFLKSLSLGVIAIGFVVVLALAGRLAESVDAGEILVVQDAFDGELHWYTTPGVKPQWFGTVTTYQRRGTYEFSLEDARIRFNDGGHGQLMGSIQYDMPLDEKSLTNLHTRYGSPEAIRDQVIKKSVDKAIYMTGPLMSSRESYAEKRTDLLNEIQDQVANGVYKVSQHTIEETDALTGQKKNTIVAEIVVVNGVPARQEMSIVSEFGIRTFNFAINELKYDDTVEKQIANQQAITMSVQTSIANARKAEQDRITTEQRGQADAAAAKWEQEKQNSTIVAEAEGRKRAAEQDKAAAEFEKQAVLLRASGEAEARRLKMAADGALEQKLATLLQINQTWANAFANAKNPTVPSVVMGGSGTGNGASSVQTLMEILSAKAAKDLAVDINAR